MIVSREGNKVDAVEIPDDMKLFKKYMVSVMKKHFYNGYFHDDVLDTVTFDKEPSKEEVVACISKAKGEYAEIKEIYTVEKVPFSGKETDSPVRCISDIDMGNVLFYRIKNPYYSESAEYEGSIKDPRKKGWLSLVAVVKTAVRNGLDITLWSYDKGICDWANDYLNTYRE